MPSEPEERIETTCCIVGGGPAGVMCGYLMARAGVDTIVLEKHGDFLRDFRGDTVHPSTLEIMHELGLLQRFLERPHAKLERAQGDFGGRRVDIADFTQLAPGRNFIAFMPQWHFLDFLVGEARKLPAFRLMMKTEAQDLIEEGGRVAGVRATTRDGPVEIRARLTIGADGRDSLIRDRGGFEVTDLGAPIDIFWFRVARDPGSFDETLLHAGPGHVLVTIDRGDYWQCAFLIPKGEAGQVRHAGLGAFRDAVVETVPELGSHIADVSSWGDVKLLSVAVDRLETWSRPGLVIIGDAAHAMSPVGGVGINLAIQDAVAAANAFAAKLAAGTLGDGDLDAVRRRRMLPTRVVQFVQRRLQNDVLAPIIGSRARKPSPPLIMRMLNRSRVAQGMAARFMGLGIRREHVRSPKA